MVGAGKLMSLLVGVPYKTAIIGVGILMVGYVVFGGMTATTWVQIIKAGLLMSGAPSFPSWLCMKAGFNPVAFFNRHRQQPGHPDHVKLLLIPERRRDPDGRRCRPAFP